MKHAPTIKNVVYLAVTFSSTVVNAHVSDLNLMPRRSSAGYLFTHDTSNPALGEAWREPPSDASARGLVWGDVTRDRYGKIIFANHIEATQYCRTIGATLPTRADFIRLREMFGAEPNTLDRKAPIGYRPQVLPNLYRDKNAGKTINGEYLNTIYFWAAVKDPGHPASDAYRLGGMDGDIEPVSVNGRNTYFNAIRCVVR